MKNFKIKPFEKNNYFYGKLLTVRDFQSEQKYSDEKRWMINKLMFGSGIAAGLNVVMIDEHTISLEPGVAIDNNGREIVVSSAVTQRLSLMDGFENTGYSKAIYMCIDYEEKGNERIQAVTNAEDTDDEISSYNRIQEGFKLYLREIIPEEDEARTSSLTLGRICVINNEKVKVYVTLPKYMNVGEEFDITAEVVKKEISCRVEFSLNVQTGSAVLNSDNTKNSFVIDFAEPSDSLSSYYSIKNRMKASIIPEKNAYFEIQPSLVRVDGKMISMENTILNYKVVNDKIGMLLKDYNGKSFGAVAEDDYNTIYVAKIELLKVESTYLIKNITDCPFGQYIYNTRLLSSLMKENMMNSRQSFAVKSEVTMSEYIEKPEVDAETDEQGVLTFNFTFPEEKAADQKSASGEVIIDMQGLVNEPKVFYSGEIYHGLGDGDVFVHLSWVSEENMELSMICGDQGIIATNNVNLKSAAIVYPRKGTFKIAVKVDFAYVGYRAKFKWLAVRK